MMKWEKKGILFELEKYKKDWMVSHVQLPVPYKINDKVVRIYFSVRDIRCHSYPVYIDIDINNFMILKFHDEPLLQLGLPGTFDDAGITFSSIVEVDKKLYMYYIGWNRGYELPYKNAIGLAISEDGGNTFKKVSAGPVMDRCFNEPYFNATPFVLLENNIFRMWFLSCTKWKYNDNDGWVPYYLIREATSTDGKYWKRKEKISINYKNDHEAIARPYVLKVNGLYHMWYSYRDTYDFRKNKNNTYMIGYAASRDGEHWVRKDEKVGIVKSDTGWDAETMCYPSVIEHKGRYIMFYNGNEHGKYAFGYAISESLI